jgi:hypothetical protein
MYARDQGDNTSKETGSIVNTKVIKETVGGREREKTATDSPICSHRQDLSTTHHNEAIHSSHRLR